MPVSTLKIYLHDGTECFRIQLIGELKNGDLKELSGCWRTAKSSVEGRPLVVDITSLKSADEGAIRWMVSMLAEGAKILDGRELTIAVPPRLPEPGSGLAQSSPKPQSGRLRSFLARLERSVPGPVQVK